jgi:hypothetical protein
VGVTESVTIVGFKFRCPIQELQRHQACRDRFGRDQSIQTQRSPGRPQVRRQRQYWFRTEQLAANERPIWHRSHRGFQAHGSKSWIRVPTVYSPWSMVLWSYGLLSPVWKGRFFRKYSSICWLPTSSACSPFSAAKAQAFSAVATA